MAFFRRNERFVREKVNFFDWEVFSGTYGNRVIDTGYKMAISVQNAMLR